MLPLSPPKPSSSLPLSLPKEPLLLTHLALGRAPTLALVLLFPTAFDTVARPKCGGK